MADEPGKCCRGVGECLETIWQIKSLLLDEHGLSVEWVYRFPAH